MYWVLSIANQGKLADTCLAPEKSFRTQNCCGSWCKVRRGNGARTNVLRERNFAALVPLVFEGISNRNELHLADIQQCSPAPTWWRFDSTKTQSFCLIEMSCFLLSPFTVFANNMLHFPGCLPHSLFSASFPYDLRSDILST